MAKLAPHIIERDKLIAACERLLKTEAEIKEMPSAQQRHWFFSKDGHTDCFVVARALRKFLTSTAPRPTLRTGAKP